MRLAFRIALRFMSFSKSQTLLIAIGIGIGISVQIFIGSLIQGLQKSLLDATIGSASHITVQASDKNEPLDEYQRIESKLTDNFPQITASSSTLTRGAFLINGDSSEQIVFRGFDLEKSNRIYKFDVALIEGKMPKEDEIAVGSVLFEENKLKLNDTVEILSPDGKKMTVKIVGVFDLKVTSINQSWVIGDLNLAQQIFGYTEAQVSSIELQISEPFAASEDAATMSTLLMDPEIKVTNWKDANAQLLSGLSGQSSSSMIIQVFVVISVVLGIVSVLAITVLQKSKQLGILKAMGINDRNAGLVFLFQGFLLGVMGGIMGIGLGLGLLWSFTSFALKADGTPVVPIYLNSGFIILSGCIAVAASTVASIIPAIKSKKLSPIEVIRNG